MIDIEDRTYQPSAEEIGAYVGNDLFYELCRYMEDDYKALRIVAYSGDNVLLGWNVTFKKAGKTLCRVYPRRGHFPMLLVVGQKEKPRVEALLPQMSDEFRRVYLTTQEGMGQRWLLLDFSSHTAAFDDAMKVVRIRRESR